jgi:2-iminoacetate synthase ThiH
MEESISQAAGSEHGDHIEVEEIQRYIHEIGRAPYERTTTYGRRAGVAAPSELPTRGARIAGAQTGY